MKVLITGTTGFIGSHLVSFLEQKKIEVMPFRGDITNKNSFSAFLDSDIDAVVHLAAIISSRDHQKIKQVNAAGVKNIVDFCQQKKVKQLIFFSSSRVLGKASDPYINSKKEAEKIVADSGLNYTIIRPSLVYGPQDKKNLGQWLKLAKAMPVIPVFNFRLQPIFIDDLINIIYICLQKQTKSVLNIIGPEIISHLGLLKILQDLGYKFKIINWPWFFSRLLKLAPLFPFLPLQTWQVKTLLANEVVNGDDWPEFFNIKPTFLKDCLRKIINNS